MNSQQTILATPLVRAVSQTVGRSLQRKCDCGQHTVAGGGCSDCEKKKLVQRRASNNYAPSEVPPVVDEVLRSPGQSLDAQTRAFMEPRFGHDFSRVRVHADARAAESAHSVNAQAYTVGSNIVFASGRYEPGSTVGMKLLAHELSHTIQQRAVSDLPSGGLRLGSADSLSEREADTAEQHLGFPAPTQISVAPSVQRKAWDTLPPYLERPEIVGMKPFKQAGDLVENSDKDKIKEHLKTANVSEGTALAAPRAGDFLLHDTSALLSAAAITKQKDQGRGLLGKGVAAYVPRDADATIARPDFYESRRPSTSEFEKATQKFEKPEDVKLKSEEKLKVWMKRRDVLLRQVWNATSQTEKDAALQRALAGLTPDEQTSEKKGDAEKDRGKKGEDFKAPFENQMKTGSTERIWTAGAWTVEEICSQAGKAGAAGVATPSADKKPEEDVKKGCAELAPYFTERNTRVSNIVAVEIVQPGVIDRQQIEDAKAKAEKRPPKKVRTNVNTCSPDNPDIVPLKDPPYSDKQYESVLTLYLRAALIAGKFPRITTHFAVDAFIGGHCDPRCFDLTGLYQNIAVTLGHDPKSIYGVRPSYGLKSGTNNVWWDTTANNICKRKPPA